MADKRKVENLAAGMDEGQLLIFAGIRLIVNKHLPPGTMLIHGADGVAVLWKDGKMYKIPDIEEVWGKVGLTGGGDE